MATVRKRDVVISLFAAGNCTLEEALFRAGYSKDRLAITASEWRRDPLFLSALEHKQAKLAEQQARGELTDAEIIDGIRDVDDEARMQGPVSTYLTIRLKCLEMLAKIRGLFIEKIEFGFGAELAKEIEAARQRSKALVIDVEQDKLN